MQSGKRPYPMMQRTNEGPEGANLPTSTATNRVFHFESAEGVIAYIKQTPWFQQNDYKDVESIEPINQGSTNYIYRVILCGLASPTGSPNVQASAIVKHAPGNLLATPEIRFSSGRQIYEVAAMETIPRVLAPDALTLPVTIPTVIHYDPIASVIVMEDLNLTRLDAGKGTSSEQTMKLSQFCSDATAPSSMPLVRDVGNALGQFLYQLHSLTSLFEKSQNPALLDLRDLCAAHEDARRVAAELIFGDFLCLLDSNSVRLTEEERRVIEDIFTRETIYLTNTMETLVMGDFMCVGPFQI